MMRLAIVATPAALPDLRPAPGALDGDVIRSRLPLPDTAFRVVDLDPSVDLAEQLDVLFEQSSLAPGTSVLFYASSAVALNLEGELFLCFDPMSPTTGDSLRDIALVFRDRAPGPVAFVIECRHPPGDGDPSLPVSVVSAGKAAVRAATSAGVGIELLIAARPQSDDDADRTSPLTRALIEALDEADPEVGLTLERFCEDVRESDQLVGVVPCFAHLPSSRKFFLLPDMRIAPPAEDVAPSSAAIESGEITEDSIPIDVELSAEASPAPPPAAPPRAAVSALADQAAAPPVGAMGSTRPPPPGSSSPPPGLGLGSTRPPPLGSGSMPPDPAVTGTYAENLATGVAMTLVMDHEGALAEFKRSLGQLGPKDGQERADIYARIGRIKEHQEKRREAIASYEKALQLAPARPGALEKLLDLNVSESDWRAVQISEDRLLATMTDPEERFARLLEFGARWQWVADDIAEGGAESAREGRAAMLDRARLTYERAREIHPDDLAVLERLRRLYEEANAIEEAIAIRRTMGDLTADPRARAEQYFSLGKYCFDELKREELALSLFDLALDSDPSLLEPLALIAQFFAERQEWSELERAYRTMLERAQRIQKPAVRSEVTWELCRRLGLLFRDHLEDPALALDAFEDAVAEKKADLSGRLIAADLARALGRHDRAVIHLQAASALDPSRAATFHALFDAFQKLRLPDQAFAAASIAVHLRSDEERERFIFEEHRPRGVPHFTRPMREQAWELLRARGRDIHVDQILTVLDRTAAYARLSQLAAAGRLPALDPMARQDPQTSTVSIVRSFAWASHFLGVRAPVIYLHDDDVSIAAVIAEEESAVVGGRVLRGRSLPELAFLAGRHLAYHKSGHRLLLYYPTIEELSACFLAGVKIALPELPIPATARTNVLDLVSRIDAELSPDERAGLSHAVRAFQAAGGRTDIAAWVAAVERCATRAGYLLAGDLDVAAGILREEPRVVASAEEKLSDLISFTVSEEHYLLRDELGVAVPP
jgi:cellulose synthase operon protein C